MTRNNCCELSAIALLGLLLSGPAAGADARGSFTVDQVMSAPFASELTAAPSNPIVAWLENEQGKRNIWVARSPDWKGHRITDFAKDDGQKIAELAWAPDSSYLLFVRGGDFENGGENPNPDLSVKDPEQAIWRVNVNGGPLQKLAVGRAPCLSPDGQTIVFVRKGQIFSIKSSGGEATELLQQKGLQGDIRWSPDGSAFAFVSRRGDHSFIGLFAVATQQVRYLDASTDRDSDPAWSPDSRRLVFLRTPSTGRESFFSSRREGPPWSLRIVDPATGSGREVFRASNGPGSVFHEIVAKQQIVWTPGNRLVFPWERSGWNHLYSIPAAGGDPAELTPGDGEVEHVATTPDGKTFYFSANFRDIDRRHIWKVAADETGTMQQVTTGDGIEWGPAPVAKSDAVALLNSNYKESAHASVLARSVEPKALAPEAVPAGFPAASLVRPQPVILTAADGMQIHGQLFLPKDDANGKRHPALVFFHGGSRRQMLLGFHYMYYYSNAYSLNQYLADQGYVVLSVNYRSGIGYGLNFREAIHYGFQGASEFNDVMGAGVYLKSRADVDGRRIGVWGGSYGGYLTALALSRASDLFAAGVDFHGVHDWSALRGYLSEGDVSGDPSEWQARKEAGRIAYESSPMSTVDTWRSPVLLIHGDDDRNVDFSQTVMLADALRKRHVPFEELIFPSEIHDFLLHQHWVTAYRATAEFFNRQFASHEVAKGTQ